MPTIFRDKVVVNEVVFNDPLDLPLEGTVGWGLDILDGWDETPEIDAQFTAIGTVDGEIPGEFFAARGRLVLVGGYVNASTRATADSLWDIIVGSAFPRNAELMIERHSPTPKLIRARRSGPLDINWTGPMAFRWAVPVRAADPFKYALDPIQDSAGVAGQSTGGRSYPRFYPLEYTTLVSGEANSVVINNSGTVPSKRIVADLNGPLSKGAWRLVNETTNELLKFDVALAVTDHLVIDFYNEVALLNGAPVTVTITGEFWTLAKGVNVIKLYGDYDPTAGFTLTAYSAWE